MKLKLLKAYFKHIIRDSNVQEFSLEFAERSYKLFVVWENQDSIFVQSSSALEVIKFFKKVENEIRSIRVRHEI